MNRAGNRGLCPRRRSHRGFTLVEVVVSLAVLSLILLATVSALRTFANTQASLDRLNERLDEVRSVSRFLRESLESAVAGQAGESRLTLGGSNAEPAHFLAAAEALEWKSAVMFGENYGGVFILRVAREADDVVLRWREPSIIGRDLTWEDMPSKVLIQAVEYFQVSVRPEFRADWVTGWELTQPPPAVVRLQIRTRGRFWPELIVPVQR